MLRSLEMLGEVVHGRCQACGTCLKLSQEVPGEAAYEKFR